MIPTSGLKYQRDKLRENYPWLLQKPASCKFHYHLEDEYVLLGLVSETFPWDFRFGKIFSIQHSSLDHLARRLERLKSCHGRAEPKEVSPPPLYIDTFVRASRGIKLLPPSGIATCSRPRLRHARAPTTGTPLHATANRKQRTSRFATRGSHLALMSQRASPGSEDDFLRERKLQFLPSYRSNRDKLAICACMCVLLHCERINEPRCNVLRTFARRKAANDGHEILSRL